MTAAAPEDRSPAQRLGDVTRALRRRWPLAMLVTALALIAGVVQLSSATPSYSAHAAVLLQPTDAVARIVNPDAVSSAANAQRDIDTYAELIRAGRVAKAVRRELALSEPVDDLLDRVSVAGEERSNLVRITARHASAEEAAAIATSFARQATRYRQSLVREEIEAAIESGRQSLAEVTDPIVADGIRGRLRELSATQAVQTGGMRVVSEAEIPQDPASPSAPLVLGLALVAGLALGTLAAIAAERLDPRLRDAEEVAAALGQPLLAKLPPDPRAGGDAVADLAAVLAARGHAARGRTILLADVGPSRLARRAADGLAASLSLGERRVRVTDSTGRSSRWEGGRLREETEGPEVGGLQTDARPGERGRHSSDVIIIAGAGILPVRDSAPLVAFSDAVILVAEDRRTAGEDARRAREVLRDDAGKVLGVVVATSRSFLDEVHQQAPAQRSRRGSPQRDKALLEPR